MLAEMGQELDAQRRTLAADQERVRAAYEAARAIARAAEGSTTPMRWPV